MKLLTALFIIGVTLSAAPITAPSTQVSLVNAGSPSVIASSVTIDGTTKTNVYIGPYTMLINGQDVPALCIAYFDESYLNTTWNAYLTPVGSSNLSGTYQPTAGQEYEEAAYIYSQIIQPNSNRTGLQEAAWDIMAYDITNSSYTSQIGDNTYIDAALANYSSMNFSGYDIVSDTTANAEQEFLIATPEPSTLTLLGAALFLAAGAAIWRRRKQAMQS